MCRVFKAPVRRCRAARPIRTNFAGRVVAYRDDEVHMRRIRQCELIPALAAHLFSRIGWIELLELLDGEWIDLAAWLAAGTVAFEPPFAKDRDQTLGNDAASGIACAQE